MKARMLVLSCALLAGCADDTRRNSPKAIHADDEYYTACTGFVWVEPEGTGMFGGGGATYKVTFTDAVGLEHVIFGIKKVALIDLPPDTVKLTCPKR